MQIGSSQGMDLGHPAVARWGWLPHPSREGRGGRQGLRRDCSRAPTDTAFESIPYSPGHASSSGLVISSLTTAHSVLEHILPSTHVRNGAPKCITHLCYFAICCVSRCFLFNLSKSFSCVFNL